MKEGLVRPWILFPYKSLKSTLTLKHLLLWPSNCRKLLILICAFMWCKLFILIMFVYDKNKDVHFCIESIIQFQNYVQQLKLKDFGWPAHWTIKALTKTKASKISFYYSHKCTLANGAVFEFDSSGPPDSFHFYRLHMIVEKQNIFPL